MDETSKFPTYSDVLSDDVIFIFLFFKKRKVTSLGSKYTCSYFPDYKS